MPVEAKVGRSVLSVMVDGMTFDECVQYCYSNEDFVRELERLHGDSPVGPMEAMVDKACGMRDYRLRRFIDNVKDLIWDRLPSDAFAFELPDEAPASTTGSDHKQ